MCQQQLSKFKKFVRKVLILVRVSCPDPDSTKALKEITKNVEIPIIADIHFHYKRAIEAAENGAKCLRINPGNIGDKKKIHDVLKSCKG